MALIERENVLDNNVSLSRSITETDERDKYISPTKTVERDSLDEFL